jgi:hypothetical protein
MRRIKQAFGNQTMRFIVMLRDPVDRDYSDYSMAYAKVNRTTSKIELDRSHLAV